MRRVLFLAYLFPPIVNSGTRRSLSFANHLPDCGWEPLVVSVQPQSRDVDEALLAEVRPGTQVERVTSGWDVLACRMASWFVPKASQKRVAEALAWRLRSLAHVPDEAVSWYPMAVKAAMALHRERGFDAVYASGWPWTSFLAARAVARRTGVPYVLDYRDMWRPTGTHAWEYQSRGQKLFGPWFERRVARNAAAVVTVTSSLVNAIQRDARVAKVHCITNGFEPSDFAGVAAERPDAAHPLVHVVYTGVWRPGYGLEDLYQAIAQLRAQGSPNLHRLRVSAAGFAPGHAQRFGVGDIVTELGQVPHQRALALMQGADVLFLPVPLGYYANASLPGKLFEYLGSGRPILAAVPVESEVARVVGDVGGSMRVNPGDVQTLADLIEGLCAGRGAELFGTQRRERLERYTRASTTRELAAVFDEVTRTSRGVAA